MNAANLIKTLKNYQSKNVFNPYRDICSHCDKLNADKIRLANLSAIIDKALEMGVDSIWIGRDLGYRGGRRTGLPFTDEVHLAAAESKWGVNLAQATKGDSVAERTAANIWYFINAINQNIFLWNVFPFHPYKQDHPLSNRSHNARERDQGLEILDSLIVLLKPEKLVAIGNDAYTSSVKLFPAGDVYKVRHPSYGGEKDFSRQLGELYSFSTG